MLIDPDTVRSYYKRYKKGGVRELLRMSFVDSEALLDAERRREADAHWQDALYPTAEAIARFIEQRWGVRYTPSGMTALLHRLGYSDKKAKLAAGRHPAPEVQEAFVEKCRDLKENRAEADVIYFIDATHPQHNPVIGCGWIKRGKEHPVASNTGRQRLTINGAINVETLRAVVRFDDTIDATSTIALLGTIDRKP